MGLLFLVFEVPLWSTGLHILTLHNAYCGQRGFFIPTFLRRVVVEVRCDRRGTRLILCDTCGGRWDVFGSHFMELESAMRLIPALAHMINDNKTCHFQFICLDIDKGQ